jgi:hypothetical protein
LFDVHAALIADDEHPDDLYLLSWFYAVDVVASQDYLFRPGDAASIDVGGGLLQGDLLVVAVDGF